MELDADDMELKDFDTKWFVGCLRSINEKAYISIVAA